MVERNTLALEQVEAPGTPPRGMVAVDVAASGLGLTQLQILERILDPGALPRVLGHEITGTVSALGEAVNAPAVGAKVLVNAFVGCGSCRQCLAGRESICRRHHFIGVDMDGGYAERVVVPAKQVCVLPSEIDDGEAILLNSAVPTAVHAVRRAGVGPGDRVAVLGAGSVGVLLCQVARAFGAVWVVAADVAQASLERVSPYADEVVDTSGLDPAAAASATLEQFPSGGPEIVFEAAGQKTTLDAALQTARTGGTVLLIGLCEGATPLEFRDYVREVIQHELTLRATYAYSRQDFPVAVALHGAGRLDVKPLIGERVDLADVPAMVEQMRTHGVGGVRHVVTVAGSHPS